MSGAAPTLWQNFRQVIGRALRETGQSLDRLGVKTTSLAITKHDYYDDPCIYEDHLSRHRQLFPLLISGRPVLHQHIAYVAPCATLIGSVYVGRNSSIWYGAVLRGDTCENTASLLTRYKIEEGFNEDGSSNRSIGTTAIDTKMEPPRIEPQSTSSDGTNQNGYIATSTTELSDSTAVVAATSTAPNHNTDLSTLQNIPKPWPLSETRRKDQLDHHGGAIFIGDNTNVQDAAIITSYQNHCTIGNNVTIGHSAQLHSCTVQDNVLIGMGSVISEGVVVETNAFIAAGAVVPENTIVPSGTLWMGNPARYVRDLTPQQKEKILYQSSEYVQVALTHQHVMELGGNVDAESGVAVYLTSDETEDIQQLEQSSTTTTGSIDDTAMIAGHINGANTVKEKDSTSPSSLRSTSENAESVLQPERDTQIHVVGSNQR
jgi:carbonic anhydrase/acetyltransferase-like protein (isoleucine patch superfamily)